MRPLPVTLISCPPGPVPFNVTSTSIDWPGSIRRGAGKHSPVLLKFCVNKSAKSDSTEPPTTLTANGNQAVHRGWRLRSCVDAIGCHRCATAGLVWSLKPATLTSPRPHFRIQNISGRQNGICSLLDDANVIYKQNTVDKNGVSCIWYDKPRTVKPRRKPERLH